MLEQKLGMMDWPMRVTTSLLGLFIVDTWYAYSQCTKTCRANTNTDNKQKDFYSFLAEELINNNYDSIGPHNNSVNAQDTGPKLVTVNGLARCKVEAHLSPTNRTRRIEKGVATNGLYQGKYRVCKKKTVFVHRKEVWLALHE
jgi:hypothetical protein